MFVVSTDLRSSLFSSNEQLAPKRYGKSDFDMVCEEFFVVFENVPFKEKNAYLEKILDSSNLDQVDFLWTILQPVSHRDFHYFGKIEYPGFHFQKLSTPITRKIKRHKKRDKSAFIRTVQDAKQINDKYEDFAVKKASDDEDYNEFEMSEEVIDPVPLKSSTLIVQKPLDKGRVVKLPQISPIYFNSGPMKQSVVKFKDETNISKKPKKFTKSLYYLDYVLKSYSHNWNDKTKNEFLNLLIKSLDCRHQYFMLTRLILRKYRNFLSLLPEHLSLKILGYLNLKDLKSASLVCRDWYKLTKSEKLWKSKCQKVIKDASYYAIQANFTDWRKLFQQRDMLKTNWSTGKYKIIDLKGHSNTVLCLTIDESRLATGSLDRTVKVWSLLDGGLKLTLYGHYKGVWCLKFITKYLLCSGSFDSTIKIWNLKDGTCSRTLFSHFGPIWALAKSDNILVSASQDKTAKVWDISSCDLVFNLQAHKEAVFCADITNELIVTGSADRTVKLWDRTNGKCLKTILIDEHFSVISLSIDKGFLACSSNQIITIWRLEQRDNKYFARKIQEYKEHFKRIECLKLSITDPINGDGLMASASQDGYIKYWNIKRSKSIHTFDVHNKKRVNCVYFDEFRIASAANDNSIKILNFYFNKK